ncbi:MAG TPA: hypothetical protein PK619_02090 [bacterium]|nr:hypothetical protein [bacterium]HPN81193.1 hypothetical protein [bacterium]HPW39490.1 hypothetical protein [bacterium]
MEKINLLPEDFRQKDTKDQQKIAKRPKIFEVQFSGPPASQRPDLTSDKPRQSWWQRVFGSGPAKPSKANQGSKQKPVSASLDIKTPRVEKINLKKSAKPAKAGQPKSFWANIFGRANLPTLAQEPKSLANHSPLPMAPKAEPSQAGRLIWKEDKLPVGPTVVPPPAEPMVKNSPPALGSIKPSAKVDKQATGRGYRSRPPRFSKPEQQKTKHRQAASSGKIGFDINLIPEELVSIKYYSIRWQVFIIFLAVTLPCLVIYGFYFIINGEQAKINNKINAYHQELTTMREDLSVYKEKQNQNIGLQRKLLALSWVLKEKIYWSNFFNLLEKHTLDGVYYRTLAADTSGDFVLPAVADSYQTMAEQIVALEQAPDFVKTVKVDGARLMSSAKAGVVGVMFDLKISLSDDILKKQQP